MAQTGLLLPSEPLFIVDKSWRLKGFSKQTNKGSIDAFASQNFKVAKPKTQPHAGDYGHVEFAISPKLSAATTLHGIRDGLRFIEASEAGGRQTPQARKTVKKHARRHANQAQTIREGAKVKPHLNEKIEYEGDVVKDNAGEVPLPSEPGNELDIVVSNSTNPLYGNEHAKGCTGFEGYLHYYRYVIARSAYPLEKHLNFEVNPIRGTCFPLALTDRLFLQTIMLISAIHHAHVTNTPEPTHTDVLARRVLNELRNRIARKDVSNATLLSVSCIALLENVLGHHKQWHVHNTGMNEMLRLRGGVETIDTSIRWKIYRADLVGAIDHLREPMLPHPGIRPNLAMCTAARNCVQHDAFKTALEGAGMSERMHDIFQHIYQVTYVVNRAIQEKEVLSACFYDNSCMQIQHDLLQTTTNDTLNESWKIAGLLFMNTFNRSDPFAGHKCNILAQQLRLSFGKALKVMANKYQHLWLAFIGALASSETNEREWFNRILINIIRACDCQTWEEVKTILSKFLWLAPLHDEDGLKLWDVVSAVTPGSNYNFG